MSVLCAHGFSRPMAREDLAGDGVGGIELFVRERVALVATRFDEEPDAWESLVTHNRVLARVLERGPVVPVKAGYLLHSDEAAEHLLRHECGRADRLLERFAGRVEANVRFVYDEEAVIREIIAANPQLRRVGAGYAQQVLAGERIAAQLERKREREAAQLLKALEPHAEDVAIHEPGDLVALNASFLLREDQVPEFEAVLARLQAANESRMSLKYVMPLPFYSFLETPEG